MNNIIHVNDQTFDETMQDTEYAIVDFTADWCPPCQMMHPIYQQMAEKYGAQIKFLEVDSERSPQLVVRYSIQAMPTFTLFKNGEPVQRLVGSRPGRKFEAEIQDFISS